VSRNRLHEVNCFKLQVQVLIHVRPADRPGEKCYELVDCGIDTSIKELKQKVSLQYLLCKFQTLPVACAASIAASTMILVIHRSKKLAALLADSHCTATHRYSIMACSVPHGALLDCDRHFRIPEMFCQLRILLCLLQELVFMGERCLDSRLLRDYGICHEFIKQVCSYVYPPTAAQVQFIVICFFLYANPRLLTYVPAAICR
jgi:hypothetical protein